MTNLEITGRPPDKLDFPLVSPGHPRGPAAAVDEATQAGLITIRRTALLKSWTSATGKSRH